MTLSAMMTLHWGYEASSRIAGKSDNSEEWLWSLISPWHVHVAREPGHDLSRSFDDFAIVRFLRQDLRPPESCALVGFAQHIGCASRGAAQIHADIAHGAVDASSGERNCVSSTGAACFGTIEEKDA